VELRSVYGSNHFNIDFSISKGVVNMMTPDRIVISQTGLFTLFYSKEKRHMV